MRELQFTDEFNDFQNGVDESVRKKIAYIFEVLKTQKVITTNIAKKLVNTDFYEMRIQVNNEYRVILFTIDHEDINQATQILFLNGFMKKATKDYDRQIRKAIKIIEQWKE
ncbi:MAG: type II toxin-antitoxin system RelE/ParE family toxin [Flavobacteriaceae bacterium]